MSWETWSLYLAVTAVVSITPGPAVFFVVSQASWRGPRAGLAAVFGITTASSILWTLSGLGLAAAITASYWAFVVLKWAGAAYLAWLGLTAIAASFRQDGAPPEAHEQKPSDVGAAYRDAVIVGLSNPKALLFFVALMPQFIDPTRPMLGQIVVMAVTGMLFDMASNSAYALAAGALSRALARSAVRRWFDRAVGGVFLALAGAALFVRRVS